ncbi:MAG: SDR family oxidoreductase [Betaproteobacteria bacterium]
MARKKALITGATGVVGRYLLKHLVESGAWDIVAVSRRKPDIAGDYEHIAVDLGDEATCRDGFEHLHDLTHVFFAAYQERPTQAEAVVANFAMLANSVNAIEPVAKNLEHINLVEGTKWYGSHLGPFKTPAKESDPRPAQTLFYYDQQDFLEARQQGKRWSWSAIRPHTISGFSVGSPMNLTTVIAVYAAICKELGMPLSHPGKPRNYQILYQATDSAVVARAMTWMATAPQCANQAFNITNGDLYRWDHLWPKIAQFFDMEVAPPKHISLQQFMQDKAPVWQRIVQRHGLQPFKFEEIAAWKFGDFVFSAEWDVISDMGKARRAGWTEALDTEEMFLRLFAEFRRERIIP